MNAGLGTKLRQLIAALDGDVQGVYNAMGAPFRPRFYPVFRFLLGTGEASVNAIADATGVSQPAATQTINEMKRLRLVRISAGVDRRARIVRLTAEGRQLARTLQPVWAATHRAANDLESELPASLHEVIDAAIAALAQTSFAERIRHQMEFRP